MIEENFKIFKEFWEEEIKKIENAVIDNRSSRLIYNQFSLTKELLIMTMTKFDLTAKFNLEIGLLDTKLTTALEMAHTRYMLQNRSLWVKLIDSISRVISRAPRP
ncbi:MAG: hypothetical protein JW878_03855 [Methanomicrobia archaeon]|nr:hypothetical protein [Methanomicrobia archaeon]